MSAANNWARRTKVDHGFIGDAKTTIGALSKARPERRRCPLEGPLEHYRKARKGLDELATEGQGKKPIHPQYLARLLDELAAKDAIFLRRGHSHDLGGPLSEDERPAASARILHSWLHGQCAAAGDRAQVSHPDRQVIAMCGDGGLAMMMGDLLTLRQLRLPVKVIIFRNDSLAFVELEMKAAASSILERI